MGWRENEKVVRTRWRQCLSEYAKEYHADIIRDRGENEVSLVDLPIEWLADGCIKRLGSPRLAQQEYRKWLMSRPEQRWDEPEPNGRPRGETTRAAASVALHFYNAWLKEDQRMGLDDYGHRAEMKYLAAQAVVEDLFAWRIAPPDVHPSKKWKLNGRNWELDANIEDVETLVEIVHGIMNKPKKRRDAGAFAELTFPATPQGLALKLPPKPPRK
jgi:hypothetical protein